MRKRSRENSLQSGLSESSNRKKKKKGSKLEDSGKDKKKKKEEVSKKMSKKKRKKGKENINDYNLLMLSSPLPIDIEQRSVTRRRSKSGSVPLSAAGVSKLYSMAGYDPAADEAHQSGYDQRPEHKCRKSLSPSSLKLNEQTQKKSIVLLKD